MSNQVSWWTVHGYVAPLLEMVEQWPTVGTPEWCALNSGPVRLAAIYDAAQHWALRLELNQEAHAEASRAISGALNWAEVSREIRQRRGAYIPRAVGQ